MTTDRYPDIPARDDDGELVFDTNMRVQRPKRLLREDRYDYARQSRIARQVAINEIVTELAPELYLQAHTQAHTQAHALALKDGSLSGIGKIIIEGSVAAAELLAKEIMDSRAARMKAFEADEIRIQKALV